MHNLHLSVTMGLMRIAAFEVDEPVPETRDTVAISMLRPWVDVGSVGSLVLGMLGKQLGAKEIGRLARPGEFFDFTRYRPQMRTVDGRRTITKPNSPVHYGRDDETGRDYVLLSLWEPHAMGEEYIESIVALLKHLNVTEYCRIGGMYDSVPHTRPLPVTATLTAEQAQRAEGLVSLRGSGYQGPTSIVSLVPEGLGDSDVRTTSLMVHMPHYVQLEEDQTGAFRLMEVLCAMYGFPSSLAVPGPGRLQYDDITVAAESNPGVKGLIEQLEADFDRGDEAAPETEELANLHPEVEEFLRRMGRRLEGPKDGA